MPVHQSPKANRRNYRILHAGDATDHLPTDFALSVHEFGGVGNPDDCRTAADRFPPHSCRPGRIPSSKAMQVMCLLRAGLSQRVLMVVSTATCPSFIIPQYRRCRHGLCAGAGDLARTALPLCHPSRRNVRRDRATAKPGILQRICRTAPLLPARRARAGGNGAAHVNLSGTTEPGLAGP